MTFEQQGEEMLRAENIDKVIKAVADQKFVMKQTVQVDSSSAWIESYYRESSTLLTATANIPRMSNFPVEQPIWEKQSASMQKHGIEALVSWEDAITDNIPVINRTIAKLTRAVVRSVDSNIYSTLSNDSSIHALTIAAGGVWDHATRASRIPHEQIGQAISLISGEDNALEESYEANFLVTRPADYTYLVTNDNILDAFTPTSPSLMSNGKLGTILGLNTLVTPVIGTTDEALVGQAKMCGTYKQAEGLRSAVDKKEGVSHTLRAWEIGTSFVTDPKALCIINNTRG